MSTSSISSSLNSFSRRLLLLEGGGVREPPPELRSEGPPGRADPGASSPRAAERGARCGDAGGPPTGTRCSPGAAPGRSRPLPSPRRGQAASLDISRSRSWSNERRARAGSGAEGRKCVNCLMRTTARRRVSWSASRLDLASVTVGDRELVAHLGAVGSRSSPRARRSRAWRGRWPARRGRPARPGLAPASG